MTNDFNTALQKLNTISKFKKAILDKRGYITFSNTNDKEFVLGLESFIKIFEDIKENISEFRPLQNYNEDNWRAVDNLFNDVTGKTMVNVQTKPLFVILSKINTIANSLESYKDEFMIISEDTMTRTIAYLRDLLRVFIPKEIAEEIQVDPEVKSNFYNQNVIFFGAPGTGKSHEVKEIVKNVPEDNFKRVTFHPEYDYNSFVGGYKPVSVKDSDGKVNIEYRFEPQVFAEMYVKAWKNQNTEYFLIIEEINRGNCAEIFGDIFQLLDRNPDYKVSPSADLLEYLKKELGDDADGIRNGKMIMPANLTLLATMNTSDQSLFPMDSAFKRRWKWEYVPIQYPQTVDDKSSDSFGFIIKIDDEKEFRWIDFMQEINKHIEQPHIGMDKCLGNYFIQPDQEQEISLKDFVNKVIFYLWNDVFKDEENEIFKDITYHKFFPVENNGKTELLKILDYLEVNYIKQPVQQAQEQENQQETE